MAAPVETNVDSLLTRSSSDHGSTIAAEMELSNDRSNHAPLVTTVPTVFSPACSVGVVIEPGSSDTPGSTAFGNPLSGSFASTDSALLGEIVHWILRRSALLPVGPRDSHHKIGRIWQVSIKA